MKHLHVNTNPKINRVFEHYPDFVRSKMEKLRQLILDTADETEGITTIEETLKWSEPSYITKIGSTIRIDWKTKTPNQYAMYFQCTTKLVPVFKLVYNNTFKFEGNRAIIFKIDDEIPEIELKKCITAGLTYHKVKKLPTLGL